MKSRITLLFVVCTLAFSSFGQGNKSALCQKWKIDLDAFMAEMPPEMTAMFDMLPKEQKDMAMKQMTASIEGLFVEFKTDGSMNTVSEKGPVSGTWKFIEGGKALWSKVGDEETIMDVIELSSDKMRVKERVKQAGQPEMIMTFKPAN